MNQSKNVFYILFFNPTPPQLYKNIIKQTVTMRTPAFIIARCVFFYIYRVVLIRLSALKRFCDFCGGVFFFSFVKSCWGRNRNNATPVFIIAVFFFISRCISTVKRFKTFLWFLWGGCFFFSFQAGGRKNVNEGAKVQKKAEEVGRTKRFYYSSKKTKTK